MAPELALRHVRTLTSESTVLDPMVGSGTTLRCAADHGHVGIGFDVDPLAVLMTRVWTAPLDVGRLRRRADDVLATARSYQTSPEFYAASDETRTFLEYWFGPTQRDDLARLAGILRRTRGPIGDALRLALSRIIITKERGASLARDVSHSRPHRVALESDYDVGRGFLRSVEQLAVKLERSPPPGGVQACIGDARDLPLLDRSVDAVITSPPYLNAIDYLRGHRMTLVWLGFALERLREVRGTSIGTERGIEASDDRELGEELTVGIGSLERLPEKQVRMILRYALDMFAVMKETERVLRVGGVATFVVGNSSIRGVFLSNDAVITECARRAGLRRLSRRERPLPPSRRYLPPPGRSSGQRLQQRMRTESILRFQST
jgi:hypothetical protein